MVIAALADQHVPKEEPIDLINVSFGDSTTVDFDKVPDRQNGINGYASFIYFCHIFGGGWRGFAKEEK
jgi:hypothetical protein